MGYFDGRQLAVTFSLLRENTCIGTITLKII
jgi:hypothetical protein